MWSETMTADDLDCVCLFGTSTRTAFATHHWFHLCRQIKELKTALAVLLGMHEFVPHLVPEFTCRC